MKLIKDLRAASAMEFAIMLPFLALFMLGATDTAFWLMNKTRLDNTATTVGNLIASADSLPSGVFPASWCSPNSATINYFAIASTVASPLAVCGSGGATIISGISNTGNTTIVWQERSGDAGAYPSAIGVAGAVPNLPIGYTVPAGHNVVITEIYSGISPWNFSSPLLTGGPNFMYSLSVFEPRLARLVVPQ
jgi:Flp pilus assembly protein TadG